ncbi:MAG: divergent polysaccharide deacetylase family protein [Deferrisomatales bacterium]
MPRKRGARAGGSPWPWIALVAVALAAGFWVGRSFRGAPPARPAAPPPAPAPRAAPAAPRPPAAEERVRAVLGTLDPTGVSRRVADRGEAEALLERLGEVGRADPLVGVGQVAWEPHRARAELRVGAERYPLDLSWPSAPAGARPRLAVVIDDLGRDLALAQAFLDLELPVTPAILPFLPHSRGTVELARARGREFLLHLPMQPRGYPGVDPGEGALLEGMSQADVRRRVAEGLAWTPGAAGVNNHMGSRLTELEGPMGWVMDELASRDLLFLDSATSAQSVAARVARDAGLAWARRDVFLDNELKDEAIEAQIAKAARQAQRTGQAVAIGHPHAGTLRALRRWEPKLRELGIEVVPLGRLVQRGGGA